MLKAQNDLRTRYVNGSQFPGQQLLLFFLLHLPYSCPICHVPYLLCLVACIAIPGNVNSSGKGTLYALRRKELHTSRDLKTPAEKQRQYSLSDLFSLAAGWEATLQLRSWVCVLCRAGGETLIMWEYQMFTQWDVSEQLKHSVCW